MVIRAIANTDGKINRASLLRDRSAYRRQSDQQNQDLLFHIPFDLLAHGIIRHFLIFFVLASQPPKRR
jgi:hypothetical protein